MLDSLGVEGLTNSRHQNKIINPGNGPTERQKLYFIYCNVFGPFH